MVADPIYLTPFIHDPIYPFIMTPFIHFSSILVVEKRVSLYDTASR